MHDDSRPRRHYRLVADQVLALVTAQGMTAGMRLPSERDLAEQIGVSRPSLREALIALEVGGIIEIRMGSGIYLSANPSLTAGMSLEDEDGPFEILQARCILESGIAEEAARHVTPELIRRLDDNLAKMAEVIADRPRAIIVDGQFHIAVASAIGNGVVTHLTAEIFQRRLSAHYARLSTFFERPDTWRAALDEHHTIRDAIADRDPDAARAAMRDHLLKSQERFSANFAAEPA
ncbi:FadR/GntR family transcriptional regulator [Paracoccus pacificus]|uniref:FadR/GntR family transcriptional regulator n=1 Tax=Paracoccus pacificus TaxID=1463598 RepID=A0ABW4R8Q3_9RHOB